MSHYGGPTPKKHVAYSTSDAIGALTLGKLEGWTKKVRAAEDAGVSRVKTVTKYTDKSGKQRYKGTPNLRKSE